MFPDSYLLIHVKSKGGEAHGNVTKLNLALLASSLPIKGNTYFYSPYTYIHMIQEPEEERYVF